MKPRLLLFISILAICIFADARQTINLAGEWQWRINPFEKEEVVQLPGTMDTNGKGTPNENMTETTQLSRKFRSCVVQPRHRDSRRLERHRYQPSARAHPSLDGIR